MLKSGQAKGFTLVEISVVLIIIGLIIGGIVFGSSLIRSAEIKSVMSDFEKFDAAVVTFKLKYDGLPGDITNATSFFPVVTDGNGDGRISWLTGDTQSAWQELALAGLIQGSFSGTGATLTRQNAPTGFADRAVFAIYFIDNISTAGIATANMWTGNYLEIVRPGVSLSSDGRGIIPSLDALAMDVKIDDGRPATGRVLGAIGGSNLCLNASASYNYSGSYVANTNSLCTVSVRLSAQ
ncbi:MAG: prepilin-type N-terminal cleavage/methylation domain-containing protein [Rickettsiales bacterium]|jgi:prepilin-type N-terminal cleavage/methylation domain-containing protein|nr:prepilin-type N-terminal cleavage/methylation domain-containing protein [Rickettsiales bacterium]